MFTKISNWGFCRSAAQKARLSHQLPKVLQRKGEKSIEARKAFRGIIIRII